MAQHKVDFKFAPGEVVVHKEHGYRGVIVEVDEVFKGPDEYHTDLLMGKRAPKDQPWYHVIVDGTDTITYVSERQLNKDKSGRPIQHPMLSTMFDQFENGKYGRPLH